MTFVRDIADKALFGSRASRRRSSTSPPAADIPANGASAWGFESGVSVVDRSPEWVNGVEYAQLQNQARINSGYAPLYSNETIEGFTLRERQPHGAERRLPRRSMFKDTKPYYKANVSFDGGSGAARIQHLPGLCRRRGHLQGREHGRLQPADRPHAPQTPPSRGTSRSTSDSPAA